MRTVVPSAFVAFRKKEPEEDDLYDAAIEPTGQTDKLVLDTPQVEQKPVVTSAAASSTQPSSTSTGATHGRRYNVYLGNMTWWTTDEDITVSVYFRSRLPF